jgi:amino acid adenylation domain-containing protein
MPSPRSLVEYLQASVASRPDHIAVEEPPNEAVTYRELDRLSDLVRDRLRQLGVQRGYRVGVYLRKSIDAVASVLGAMKAGAAYVPVDYAAPSWRSAYILHDCQVRVAILEQSLLEPWREEIEKLGSAPAVIAIDGVGGGKPLEAAVSAERAPSTETVPVGDEDLAYILYTSGSTGKPKGVMLSHGAAIGFVEWCSRIFEPTEDDRFSSHAPFHFDLSILDLYVPLKHAATVVLINADQGKEPVGLAKLIAERRLTIWYSTPTILTLLAQYGKLGSQDCGTLRHVLFAGEVFPVKHLRAVHRLLPRPRYFNLYGPTETNVCTFHEIPRDIPEDRTEPFPIGAVCEHLEARVLDENGTDVPRGSEGELCIAGANVMDGYWNLPDNTARAFIVGANGTRWYRTGDIVIEDDAGVFTFVGRRDRMVKRRGYRIELGEIEAGLYRHPAVHEAAVVAVRDAEGGVKIKAILACRDGATPSMIEMKRFCADALPASMIPDLFVFRDALPKTSTDKVDYQRLLSE